MKKTKSEIEILIQEMVEEELNELWGIDHLKNAANKVGGYAKQGTQAVKNAGRNVMNKITGTPSIPPVAPPAKTVLPPSPPPPIAPPKSPEPPIPDDRSVLDGHEEDGEEGFPLVPTPSLSGNKGIIIAKCMNSSMVHSFEYNEEDQTLRVYFRGGQIYDYFFVPRAIAERLKTACEIPGESAGKWFAQNVRKTYEFHKVA